MPKWSYCLLIITLFVFKHLNAATYVVIMMYLIHASYYPHFTFFPQYYIYYFFRIIIYIIIIYIISLSLNYYTYITKSQVKQSFKSVCVQLYLSYDASYVHRRGRGDNEKIDIFLLVTTGL